MNASSITAKIFVVHTPFQIIIANHMVGSMSEFADADNYLVFDIAIDKNGLLLNKKWKRIIHLQPPVGGTVIGSGHKCRSALEEVANIVNQYDMAYLFLSDVQWPLNNAIFGIFGEEKFLNVRLCNFPDGIANLYVAYPSLRQKLKKLMKSLIGRFGASPYYYYKGDQTGFRFFSKVYSLMPKAISNYVNNIVEIPLINPLKTYKLANACIFLGQSYDYFMPKEEHLNWCINAAKFTIKLGYEKLFYKPHHHDATGREWGVFSKYGFNLVQDKRAIEEIFLNRQMACVVSYNSSALIHLKLMFGSEIRCISFCRGNGLKYTGVKKQARKKLNDLLILSGVEVHE